MFYTLSSRLLVPPNTIFVTDHTTGYFLSKCFPIVILSLECYILICIDWLYVHFTAFCFSHVEVRFDISVIKELIDWLIDMTKCPMIYAWRHMTRLARPLTGCCGISRTCSTKQMWNSYCVALLYWKLWQNVEILRTESARVLHPRLCSRRGRGSPSLRPSEWDGGWISSAGH